MCHRISEHAEVALDDTTLIPNIIKAIKELKDENDALKARVEALES